MNILVFLQFSGRIDFDLNHLNNCLPFPKTCLFQISIVSTLNNNHNKTNKQTKNFQTQRG